VSSPSVSPRLCRRALSPSLSPRSSPITKYAPGNVNAAKHSPSVEPFLLFHAKQADDVEDE
jgi:hypothetical protein